MTGWRADCLPVLWRAIALPLPHLWEGKEGKEGSPPRPFIANGHRRYFNSTSSSDMLGCSATVSSNCCLVRPAFTAMAAA